MAHDWFWLSQHYQQPANKHYANIYSHQSKGVSYLIVTKMLPRVGGDIIFGGIEKIRSVLPQISCCGSSNKTLSKSIGISQKITVFIETFSIDSVYLYTVLACLLICICLTRERKEIFSCLQISRWYSLKKSGSIGPCSVMSWATLPMITSLSPTLAQDNCVPLTRGRWLSTEHPAVSGTGPLQLLPQEFGTVCRHTYEKQSYHTAGSGGRWRHFLDSPITTHCELFLTAPCRNILTCSLTYIVSHFHVVTIDKSFTHMHLSSRVKFKLNTSRWCSSALER